MQGPWPARQVESEFVLPKGWTQVEVAFDHKTATGWWNADGERVPWRHDTVFTYSQVWLNLDHGFSRHIRAWVRIPFVNARLRNGFGTDTSTFGMGDVLSGVTVQPWLGRPWHIAYQLELKAPSGSEWPNDFIGGPANVGGFLLGTGITNLGFRARHRYTANRWVSAELDIGYVAKLPAVTGYVLEADGFSNGWFDPGDAIEAHAALTTQLLETLALSVHWWLSHRGVYRIGTSGPSTTRVDFTRLEGSSGTFIDASAALDWTWSPHLSFGADARFAVHGENTGLFGHLGLEEFSPQPGFTLGGRAIARW